MILALAVVNPDVPASLVVGQVVSATRRDGRRIISGQGIPSGLALHQGLVEHQEPGVRCYPIRKVTTPVPVEGAWGGWCAAKERRQLVPWA